MIAEIIAAGPEMLTPFRQDTNSLYLAVARGPKLSVSDIYANFSEGELADCPVARVRIMMHGLRSQFVISNQEAG
jgi:hypothetical protein